MNGEEVAVARRLRSNASLKCRLRNSRAGQRKRTGGKFFKGERCSNEDGRNSNVFVPGELHLFKNSVTGNDLSRVG